MLSPQERIARIEDGHTFGLFYPHDMHLLPHDMDWLLRVAKAAVAWRESTCILTDSGAVCEGCRTLIAAIDGAQVAP